MVIGGESEVSEALFETGISVRVSENVERISNLKSGVRNG